MTRGSSGVREDAGSIVLGFLMAPLAVVPATLIVLAVAYGSRLGRSGGALPLEILTSLATIALFGVPVAYLAAVVLGIPAYFAARRLGLLSLRHSLAIGATVALLPLWLFFAYVAMADGIRGVRDLGTALAWTVLFAACGASSGATFWHIALRSRRQSGGAQSADRGRTGSIGLG